jgi:hypothetical protein
MQVADGLMPAIGPSGDGVIGPSEIAEIAEKSKLKR